MVPAGIRCWGRNDQGQFGDQTDNSTNLPGRPVAF
jgi:hypothetical protein